jgi:hypothetical protein
LGTTGYEALIGYRLNANMQIAAGWQRLDERRNAGAFYNGGRRLRMNAGFVHLRFHI